MVDDTSSRPSSPTKNGLPPVRRQMAPTIDVVAGEYAGKAKVGKLDVDANGGTAMRYNVRGIPTLLLFKGGQVVEQRVGAIGKSEVQKMLDAHV